MGTTWIGQLDASKLASLHRSFVVHSDPRLRGTRLPVGYQDTLRTSSLTSKPSSPSRVCQDVNVYWPWRAHGLNMGLKPPAIAGYHVTAADCEDE